MEHTPKLYIISGVCGAGKTSVLAYLKKLLPINRYDIRDFDERGVPDGGGLKWHTNETRYWLDVAVDNARHGISTIIGGFAQPERFWDVYQGERHPPAQMLLLHASSDTLRKRLYGRYPTPESVREINRTSGVPLDEFVSNNISFAPELRSIFEKAGSPIIDTDFLTSEEVAKEIIKHFDT